MTVLLTDRETEMRVNTWENHLKENLEDIKRALINRPCNKNDKICLFDVRKHVEINAWDEKEVAYDNKREKQ